MIKSNRAAALRWLAAHAGQTLDTLAYENGELCWAPGPRRLDNVRSGSASGWVMVRPSEHGGSHLSTGTDSKFFVDGDTLIIRSMVHMVSGPNGVVETFRETHYFVATPAPFVVVAERCVSCEHVTPDHLIGCRAVTIADVAAASDGRIRIIPVRF